MLPHFETKEERLAWVRANKSFIMQAKRNTTKHSDSISGVNVGGNAKMQGVIKELGSAPAPINGIIQVKSVINTTNLLDSHMDVHIPGLWKKSLNEVRDLHLLKEHKNSFESVISDEVTASTRSMSWKSLGYSYDGNTQALIFDSLIKEKRNPYMFEQYADGNVRNHSVGMRYVKIVMCVNSEEKYYAEEKEAWDKYYPEVANKEDVDEMGMFFAVTEAKICEGSAVLFGSNFATPTLEVTEAGKSTPESIEPPAGTQERKSMFARIGSQLTNNA